MKKILILTALIITIIAASVFLAFFSELTRSESSGETVTVTIPMGASEKTIASILKENGVIKYETAFRIKMKTSPYRGKLNYGKYVLKKNMPLAEAIEKLANPSSINDTDIKLTIPEGYSAEMIAQRCESLGLVSAQDFLYELTNGKFYYDFINDIPNSADVKYALEGYLFPSTYMISKDETAYDIIDKILAQFQKEYDKLKDMLPEGMTMAQAINRAALIEREAKLDSEREIISGVIQNRLRINMALQIDASVVYAISGGLYDVTRVLYKDLKVDSPYNTYKYPGLPAGPICNPGTESIIAAMKPAQHKYLYYRTDTEKNDGSHTFTETFSQHKK